MTEALEPHTRSVFSTWGFWAILSGGVGVLLFFAQIHVINSAEAPSIGQQIGEIAGDIRRSAWRSFLGLPAPQAEPVPQSPDWVAILAIAAPVFGVLAVILAGVSMKLHENWRVALLGAGLGFSAILFQFMLIMALLIVGCMILVAIISNMDGIFGG
ncbi:MAG: hypothetical protein EP307_08410 [Rhodobacteraceae bacterium]|nr:MAG: hypothetical protein EP307_08410 [Paracoccaceae bacterium]